ncbi:protein-methionine-sulfoxide reductase catalytic subunit MsrP [Marinihelvus fidelis]|uniref:Protein-methionine-sulfoxide reductase catalytic subunit MsrP n=1 Tax=Marinihelvus fidelis TaxID=2613842 RepID=A0A5N0TFS6_9GAMM|nr:protein-methionine-sulfoxide reductase catalytic subunit MsrP [Marinihelvus fidelis]KAA9133348.1 protein-methionine-sulfoxide reductase catalytic subunit MsrP [Marinihelvus fidelis]
MLIRKPADIPSSEITPEAVWHDRRRWLKRAGLATAGLALPGAAVGQMLAPSGQTPPLEGIATTPWGDGLQANSWQDITTYNNFYEFGTGKADPAERSGDFEPRPWTVRVDGRCGKPGDYHFEDLFGAQQLEERIYRLRCVEAWSMVVPWVGVPLSRLLERFEPDADARFVRFKTVMRREQMPGLRRPILDWPYQEGLTMAEAMHPLTLMAIGVYGRELPNQNGAPMRLVVPWKYGFKSIKSINAIEFTSRQPKTSWSQSAPREYGFYANVNPEVDHPRWSQASERPIGAGLFASRQPTLMFNGYAEQVADLYSGLDLRRNY